MKSRLSEEALELGAVVRSAIAELGGVEIARLASLDPSRRGEVIEPVLGRLGLWDLSPLEDQTELEAAAASCRAAGWHGLPYPIAERLARPSDAEGLLLIGGRRPLAVHADLPFKWVACDILGNQARVVRTGPPLGTKLGTFISEIEIEVLDARIPREAALLTTLQLWWLVGLLGRATDISRAHSQSREQFGRPLAANQAVQFMIADMVVALQCLTELAKYTIWSLGQRGRSDQWVVDALALRVAGLETAREVMRTAHQIHGAIGFCDEHDLSWLSRLSHGVRRIPLGQSETEELLLDAVKTSGFDAIFPVAVP
jgi:3-oxo-4-pregnene-20-carboxyl-CoA dehydrogenase alpha subunit